MPQILEQEWHLGTLSSLLEDPLSSGDVLYEISVPSENMLIVVNGMC